MSDIVPFTPRLDGMVPTRLMPRSAKIHLDSLEVMVDIGFHDFEVGTPQRLVISVEVWLEEVDPPAGDSAETAWNYDHLRLEVERVAASQRFNLQETLARKIYDWTAARAGVKALRVATAKPDVYPNAQGVGVEIASFVGTAP
jgi:7,8-dihydroneopterin aldolase/epimerase/oxygenase